MFLRASIKSGFELPDFGKGHDLLGNFIPLASDANRKKPMTLIDTGNQISSQHVLHYVTNNFLEFHIFSVFTFWEYEKELNVMCKPYEKELNVMCQLFCVN